MTDINRTACTFSRPALNANTLKLIAVLAMVLDHAATVFLADTAPAALFFHAVGQIAAPIMCFFVALFSRRRMPEKNLFAQEHLICQSFYLWVCLYN